MGEDDCPDKLNGKGRVISEGTCVNLDMGVCETNSGVCIPDTPEVSDLMRARVLHVCSTFYSIHNDLHIALT